AFSIDNPDLVPDGNSLMKEVYSWLESATEGRAQYYSAEEPPPQTVIPKQSRQKNRAPVGGASPPKRVTTATLAEQLAELSKSIHATSSQLETMAQRQDRMENLLASPAAPAQLPVPAHQRPFQTEKATRTPLAPEVPEIPEDEPLALPSDPDFVAATAPTGNNQPMDVTSAIFQQSQALSTLVAHLVNQDGLADFAGTGSSSAISLKGSAKRDKLMMDLAMRKGDFFLKVSQNAFRRLKPTEKMPRTLEEFAGKPIFAKYAERSGGFSGQRDFGLMMWLLCQIGDAMINGDNKGAQELLALTLVTIEQAAQDNGKWEVAWILSLQEDPPSGPLHGKASLDKSEAQGFLSTMPSRVGSNCVVLCQGGGYHQHPTSGGPPIEEDSEARGGGRQSQEEATEDSYDMHHDAYHYIPCSGSEDFCRDDGTFADDAGPFEEEPASERCGSRQRRRLMVDRAFHVCIMALNFWHADFKHIPVESIAKEPSPAQAQALVNLKRMLRAFGSSQEEFSVPKSGRRLTSLIALLSDPSEFATWRGIGGSAYSRSFPGAPDIGKKETYVPRNLSRAEELRPYRALDPDRNFLYHRGLLTTETELRADCPFYGSNLATGLVIDDYYAVSIEENSCPIWNPDQTWTGRSQAAQLLQKATTAYEEAGLLGSPAKDILDEQKACIMGAEIDGSQAARENGVVTVGAPVHRRLALAYVSLTLAKMRYTTDALHVCLVGGWVNAVLYRRPAMSLLQEVYKIPLSEVSQDSPKVIRLSRGMAQELIMLAVLCPFLATDISTHVQEQCYATDSSDAKGAVVSCKVPRNIARALVRTGRKKTTYTKMLAKHEAVLKKIDIDFEEADIPNDEFADDSFTAPDRPRAFRCRACASILSVLLDFSLGLDFMDFQHLARAAGRGDLELPQGRPVLPETQKQRDKLLSYFSDWLRGHGFELEEVLMAATPDLETLNTLVEKYGRELYRSGRPYGHYSETLNAISGKRPRVRRHLQPAWDLAYAWLRQEPPAHHLALPWQALLSLISTSWTWGWSRVAGVIALSWGGITRIGEVLSACRRDLILPGDVEWSINYALLQIAEPKTRYRCARHQIAWLDQPQLLKVIEVAFGGLLPEQRLWPASGQTMRHRFQKLLQANKLDTLPEGISRGIDLGSLRAGGASWLLMSSENSELTRRRGRWITSKVMEVYVQEAWSVQFLPRLPPEVKKLIWNGAQIFPWALDLVVAWHEAKIPESARPCLFLQASKDFELDHLGAKSLGGAAAAAAVCAAPKEP
ncbi:unnamed protein product, partial [Durusdinium trenchii]